MHAIVMAGFGGTDVLQWSQVPDPEPTAGEVVIDVAATAVNRADLLQRQGFYPPPAGAAEYLGLECSGTIAALGADVRGWAVGDEVCALLSGGGYAERVAVPAGQLLPVPGGVDLVSAAALPEVTATVHSNLIREAELTEGEWLLVHGGGSGIGTMATQVAAALGVHVAVTAGSPAKLTRCQEFGAEVLINYRELNFVDMIREATDGRGADVILDNMGGSYLNRNVESLARDGRLVVIGMQGGTRAELDLNSLLRRNGRVIATSLRARPAAQKAEICAAVVDQVWPLISAGTVRPVIDRVLPITQAAAAHRILEAGGAVGKVVLRVGS